MTYNLLEGLRVLELGDFISAPYCGKLLADMGADVIKIEPPGAGDWARQYGPFLRDEPHPERSGLFLYLNANKRGVTLDLSTPTGRSLLAGLADRSDALVHNIHPTQMGDLGLDYDALSRTNPRLVMASITPFGLTGPRRDYKAYDINLAAGGGICQGLGSPDREPLTFGAPQVGYFAGMAAASSILICLLAMEPPGTSAAEERSEEGSLGQHVDIAEVEAIAGVYNGPEALMAVYQWRATRRTGHHAMDFPYPNCIMRCKDGYIFVGAPEGRQWRKLLEVMGDPQWAKDPRFANRTDMNNLYADEVDGHMEAWLAGYTKAELLELALQHQIPLAPVRGYDDARQDPSLTGLFVDIDRPDTGPLPFPGPCYELAGAAKEAPSPAPFLGEHNAEVYCDVLGHTREQLVKLRQTGII